MICKCRECGREFESAERRYICSDTCREIRRKRQKLQYYRKKNGIEQPLDSFDELSHLDIMVLAATELKISYGKLCQKVFFGEIKNKQIDKLAKTRLKKLGRL